MRSPHLTSLWPRLFTSFTQKMSEVLSRRCEVLERAVDLVQIKGLWIKFATDPVHHLLMLGVLRILDSLQKARVPPDTTTILGRTGAFACKAHRVALPCFVGEHLFNAQLM